MGTLDRPQMLAAAMAGRMVRSGQEHQAADRQVGTQDQGGAGHELPGVARQPVLAVLQRRLGGLGPQFQEHERDDDQQELDQDEQDDTDDLVRGRRFAGDQDVQPAQP
jgi:hypothetical protein